ncbi:iron reductase [Mycena pura]|uniref:Iron reductase n=1 Tax=Mycena pura TaxID=153505 RepID=A0AAD6VHP2_9AGAR|nr:iron reductase [Mycena pura]
MASTPLPDTETGTILQSIDPDRVPRIALANLYPKQVWYFVTAFIVLVAACHFVSVLHSYVTRRHAAASARSSAAGQGISWRRLPLALLNLWRIVAFRWSIMIAGTYTFSVADFLLAEMYIAVLFTWTFINSTSVEGVKYDPKYWANRCVHIAAVQLPLITALGMKNNVISVLTGVSFDKLEHLHRISARVICVMFWVHGIGRVSLPHDDDTTTYWFRIGVVGASALTLLCLLSIRPLRARNYEAFMYLHTVFGVIALAGAYVHASEFGYGVYIWPAMFLWGLDRALRLLRIVVVNSQAPKFTSDATVSVLSPHFLRIFVDAPPYFIWRPGQCAYLTIVGAYATSVTEAHPFTIANALPMRGVGAVGVGAASEETPVGEKEDKSETPEPSADGAVSNESRTPSSRRHRLMFILRVRDGFTKRLLDAVLTTRSTSSGDDVSATASRSFKAFIDGPYSSPPVVRGFETVVFISGGSGVSFSLPLFLDLVQAARATPNLNPRCTRAVFVWAIRDPDQITWIADTVARELLGLRQTHPTPPASTATSNATAAAAAGATPVFEVDIRLHVTAAPEDTQALGSSGTAGTDPELAAAGGGLEKKERDSKEHLLGVDVPGVSVQLIHGRPNIKEIVRGEIDARSGRGGAVSVNVCGTTELAQSVRRALSDGPGRVVDVLRGGPSVVLHVEGFGGA